MSMLSPKDRYLALVQSEAIILELAQQDALNALDDLWSTLLKQQPSKDFLGVYLWGSVGRGKTMLMNLFYESLPDGVGRRQHFHHFMAALHRELNTTFGVANPLKLIASRIAQETKVICFDEFFVSDIADAMLLGNLIEALFEEGVYLVATSNIPVSGLFQNQLQKDRFAPAIALMEKHLHSFHLDGQEDFRFRLPIDQKVYFTRLPDLEHELSCSIFSDADLKPSRLTVNHRALATLAQNDIAIWFDFSELCEQPRSAQDYIQLANQYRYIVVTKIPELSSTPYERIKARGTEDGAIGSGQTGEREVSLGLNDDAVRRFISLVDECYDQGIGMFFHADVPLDTLYTNGILLFEFQRTYSRMTEMQTSGYLSRIAD